MSSDAIVKGLMESMVKFHKLHMHLRIQPQDGLRPSEMFTFFIIKRLLQDSDGGGVKVTDVSRKLDVAPSTVSRTINNLVTQGYIIRTHSSEDRRAVLLRMSEKGKEVFDRMKGDLLKNCIELSQYLGVDDSRKFSELLSKSYEFLKKPCKRKEG